MKKTLTAILSIMAFAATNAKVVKTVDVSAEGKRLCEAIPTEEAMTIDSIAVVNAVLDKNDLAFLARCCEKGSLSGIDLSKVTVKNDEIPDCTFRPSAINSSAKFASEGKPFSSLTYIRLPYNVYRIGEQAFFGTNLKEIEIPKTVGIIGNGAFSGCSNLGKVVVINPDASSIDMQNAFDADLSKVSLTVPSGSGGSYASCAGWSGFGRIAERSELYNTRIVKLGGNTLEDILGEGLLATDSLSVSGELKDSDFKTIRKATYEGRLTGIDLSNCTVANNALPEWAFADESIPSNLLRKKLLYVKLPKGLTSIGSDAFAGCQSLQAIHIPSTVTYIGEEAFNDCRRAKGTLTIPEGVSRLSSASFENCAMLSEVYLPSTLSVIEPSCFRLNTTAFEKRYEVVFKVNRMSPPAAVNLADSHNPFGYKPDVLKDFYRNSTLYVPVGAKPAFEADEVWSCFGNIVETSELDGGTSGISATAASAEKLAVSRIYTLDGRYAGSDINSLGKGVYVVNGKKFVR